MSVDYDAAVRHAALFDRQDRAHLLVRGRAPRQMLNGILSGTVPNAPGTFGDGVLGGVASYTAILTPKGRMITDGRVLLLGPEDDVGFLLDVPTAGRDGLLAHLRKSLPPRMASVEDVSEAWRTVSVVGPRAAAPLAASVFGSALGPEALSRLAEGEWRAVRRAGGSAARAEDALVALRSAEVWPEAFDVSGPPAVVARLREGLLSGGVERGSAETWRILRVEAGRPEFGVDMDEDTIPVEAGIHERAIDYGKGCYTGQEVIVRIRDRGHVNRSLRLVHLGEAEPPARGTELFTDGSEKAVGLVTSSVRSPRDGETLALAYVRRGVERVRLAE